MDILIIGLFQWAVSILWYIVREIRSCTRELQLNRGLNYSINYEVVWQGSVADMQILLTVVCTFDVNTTELEEFDEKPRQIPFWCMHGLFFYFYDLHQPNVLSVI